MQCAAPALRDRRWCRFHGGRALGPTTEAGKQRCAMARTIHCNDTAQVRRQRSYVAAELAVLEWAGHTLGFMQGPRTRGRKPQRMAEAYPDLQEAVHQIVLSRLAKYSE